MKINNLINKFYSDEYYLYTKATELCDIMDSEGSDKGPNFKNSGNYTKMYNFLFSDIRENVKRVFEVGIGSNNLDVPSNMGIDGVPGSSLRGWKRYFKKAKIVGADIDERILFTEDRISTYYVDQYNNDSIDSLWDNFKGVKFDIIIDDGIHDMHKENSGNVNFFKRSIKMLNNGGYYIIEDVAMDSSGNDINPLVNKFVDDINSGIFGNDLESLVVKIPAYLNNKKNHTHYTQMIIIKRTK